MQEANGCSYQSASNDAAVSFGNFHQNRVLIIHWIILVQLVILVSSVPLMVPSYFNFADLSQTPIYEMINGPSMIGIHSILIFSLVSLLPSFVALISDFIAIFTKRKSHLTNESITNNPLLSDLGERCMVTSTFAIVIFSGLMMLANDQQEHKDYVIVWIIRGLSMILVSSCSSILTKFSADRFLPLPVMVAALAT